MKSNIKRPIISVLLISVIVSSTSMVGYAAGFWNYSHEYHIKFRFVGEGCPWAFRSFCSSSSYRWVELKPGESWSSNNNAGWVVFGEYNDVDLMRAWVVKQDKTEYSIQKEISVWIERQGVMTFHVADGKLYVDVYHEDKTRSSDSFVVEFSSEY